MLREEPLVSCILSTTQTRRRFLPNLIRCFNRQTWSNKELIIVDDEGIIPPMETVPNAKRIVVPPGATIGKKVNIGVNKANGEYFQKWDDDDWYHPDYIRYMMSALDGAPKNSVVAVDAYLAFLLDRWEFRFSGTGCIAGGTLTFRCDAWCERPFPEDVRIGEDVGFCRRREHIVRVSPPPFIYIQVRHGRNTWRYWNDRTVEEEYQRRNHVHTEAPEDIFDKEEIDFYRNLHSSLYGTLSKKPVPFLPPPYILKNVTTEG